MSQHHIPLKIEGDRVTGVGDGWVARRINDMNRPWAVINPNGPHGDEIIAGNLTEEHAHLFAAAREMRAALSALVERDSIGGMGLCDIDFNGWAALADVCPIKSPELIVILHKAKRAIAKAAGGA